MTVPSSGQPEANLRPVGPYRVYDLILADIEAGELTGDLPSVSALARRYGSTPDEALGARYLLAADNRVRFINQLRWSVGPAGPEDPQNEIVETIRAIRADKARDTDDPSHLDVYAAAPSRETLAARYSVREHSVRIASELEFPGLPSGSSEADLEAFAGFVVPTGPRELQPALVEHLRRVVETRAPRERLPSPAGLARRLGVDKQQVTRAYTALVTAGWCVGATGNGTFVGPAERTQDLSRREYTRHELRRLIGEALTNGEFPNGELPAVKDLRTRWSGIGFVFNPKQITSTLDELLAEGSVRREGSGPGTTWLIDTVPALSPPEKPQREHAAAYAVWDIADELERRINDGEYRTGYRLPTDDELAEEFGVSPNAAQDAMHVLAIEGFVSTVMASGTWNRLSAKPGRYVAPPRQVGHSDHLAAASVVKRIDAELAAGAFIGLEEEVECDRDSVWPSAKWFAENYGVREDTVHTALLVHGRRGNGANLRRDPKYSIPLEAFDPGPDGPPPIKSREWAAKGGREGWVVERIEEALERYPAKGLRLPKESDLIGKLQTSHTTVRLAIKQMSDRLTTRRNQGGGVFTTAGEPTAPVVRNRSYTKDFQLDLASPPAAGSRPEDIEKMAKNPPIGWEGTPSGWQLRLISQVGMAAKQALLVATADGTLTPDVIRDNAVAIREGVRRAVDDARTGGQRPTHTRAQFRNEARQLLTILEGVAPHVEFDPELVESWIGPGGIRYGLRTKTPMPPALEREFLVGIYDEVDAAFAGPLEFAAGTESSVPAIITAIPRRRASGAVPTTPRRRPNRRG